MDSNNDPRKIQEFLDRIQQNAKIVALSPNYEGFANSQKPIQRGQGDIIVNNGSVETG